MVLLGALIVTIGCSSGGGPTLHPVTGKILVDDQPAAGATVVFHPTSATAEALRPSGVAGADGTFTLNTYPHGNGAPEGEYVVLVTWFESLPPPKDDDDADPPAPKSKLPARYTDVTKSGLKATIKSGDNTLEPFKLTAKKAR